MAASEILAKVDEPAESAAATCLSDDEVLAFASGTLDAARQATAHLHLDHCELCQRLLSEAAHALATAVTAPFLDADELSWNTTFKPGTLVGRRYLIRQFIARGGMGEVYEAFDRDLQERVALKTVTSTACDNPSAVRRLKAEVQLARRVSHPNVCRIYDFGTHVMPETGAQISFLTMEFVEGETLGQRIRLEGALPVDEARAIGRQLLGGLSAAHEAGVLHRDFKSDNVMLRAEAGGGCSALILDFGLARALDEGSRNVSSSAPNLLGTFGYIAPEQLQGKPHSTGSDVYSFGIVWFEMLTGELPFEAESSPVATALARLQDAVPAPSSKNPLVPKELEAVVLGCLRRSPKERYRTASEVLGALDEVESQSRSAFQKRRLIPLTIAAVLGAIATYIAAIPAQRKPEAITHALLPAASASQSTPLLSNAAAISRPLSSPIGEPPPLTVAMPAKQPRSAGERAPVKAPARPAPRPVGKPNQAPTKTAEAASPSPSPSPSPARTSEKASPNPDPARIPVWENPFDTATPNAAGPIRDGGS